MRCEGRWAARQSNSTVTTAPSLTLKVRLSTGKRAACRARPVEAPCGRSRKVVTWTAYAGRGARRPAVDSVLPQNNSRPGSDMLGTHIFATGSLFREVSTYFPLTDTVKNSRLTTGRQSGYHSAANIPPGVPISHMGVLRGCQAKMRERPPAGGLLRFSL